ncbi:MAG: hypothetical protein BWK79_09300 [Beggiatoa sp. IS2]|nr:MAG: hypothetical protein BWK79_09300 [Beggiatoa sp. IS2]
MKKSIKYSVALVSTTLLGTTLIGEKPTSDNLFLQSYQNVGNDSFLSKLGKEWNLPNVTLLRQSYASGAPLPNTIGSGGTTNNPPSTGTGVSGGPSFVNSLAFEGLRERYNVGDIINISAQIVTPSSSNSQERLDLWVALYIPGIPGDPMFFLTGSPSSPSFSPEPQPFQRSLNQANSSQGVLAGFQVPPDIGGEYILFALLVAEGQNPLESEAAWRSNLAKQSTTINN